MTTHVSPMLHVPASLLPTLHRALARDSDALRAAMLLREIGYETGREMFDRLIERMEGPTGGAELSALSANHFWSELAAFFRESGWGDLRLERPHLGIGALVSTDWREGTDDSGEGTGCQFSTGLLADLLRRTAGAEIAVLEVECRSRGHDGCRFLFGSPEVLTAIHDGMRDGLSYTAALDSLG